MEKMKSGAYIAIGAVVAAAIVFEIFSITLNTTKRLFG